ncbi:tetratricopeptide repeat protein [Oscillatoria salina]|uniref:tetratricopeptide repeat protein n=1 Tax=Oscillatoria salina TaxID=331517 RepID=UPI001CCC52FA|nr:tetratricopeptide repeat protein [Oscillatoria salina]MBZ8178687.1 tetratricopeptide repeat protein [Oscillatoria salina IIICB1]
MPTFSYGEKSQQKVQELLEALLNFVDGELGDDYINAKVSFRWEEKDKKKGEEKDEKDKDELKLTVETTLETLRQLIYGKGKIDPKAKKTQRKEIGAILTHYLGKFLGIWEDRRLIKRGSERWVFVLKLWSKDKEENLRRFQEEWRKRQPNNSVSVSVSVEMGGKAEESEENQQKRAIGLETLPEVRVWEGRETLVESLRGNLLVRENPPKVVALVGQGGIGKTSLGVKLLEAVGVELKPPRLGTDCAYDTVFYFKTEPGTSFDEIAEFLLENLTVVGLENFPDAAQKIKKIIAELTNQHCLLFLDNLEVILQPASEERAGYAVTQEWGQFLNQLVYSNHCSQVILTSRELPRDLADSRCVGTEPDPNLVCLETVGGVAVEAGVKILRQYQLKDKESDLFWVSSRVDGQVFILTQLAAIGRRKPGYLRKHPELVTKKAEPILLEQLKRQTEAAKDLLRRMCVLRVGIDVTGLTFLRLYTNDLAQDPRFEIASEREEAAELTDGEIEETEAIIQQLVDCSLVQSRYDEEECETYYDLHRIIVEFLQAECKNELPQLLETVYKFYCTGKNVENPQSLNDLRPVLEAQFFAFQLGNYREAYLLVNNLGSYLRPWGHWNLLKDLCEEVLPYLDGDYYGICLQWIGVIYRDLGRWNEAKKYFTEALANAEKQESKEDIAYSVGLLGEIERNRGNWDEAQRLFRQSLQLHEELGDRTGMAAVWGVLGDIERNQGNWDEAEKLYRQSLQLREELGDRAGMASSWGVLGEIERNRGNWAEAQRLYRQCLQIEEELGDRAGMPYSIGSLGEVELGRGNLDTAEKYLIDALERFQALEDVQYVAECTFRLAQVWRKRGNEEVAEEHYHTAYQIYQQLGAAKDLEKIEKEWN